VAVPAQGRRRVVLPTYPFERVRCWLDAPVAGQGGLAPSLPAVIDSRPLVVNGHDVAPVPQAAAVTFALQPNMQPQTPPQTPLQQVIAQQLQLMAEQLALIEQRRPPQNP